MRLMTPTGRLASVGACLGDLPTAAEVLVRPRSLARGVPTPLRLLVKQETFG
jgi:hypothetical protein